VLEGKHDYVIVDGNLEDDPVAVLAVTVMPGPQLHEAVPHCQRLKALHPDLTIVWGGYFPTQHYDVCLRADYVDYVVRGHGEYTFAALIDAVVAGQAPGPLPGLAYRALGSGEIVASTPAPIPSPEGLPGFPYQRVDLQRYIRSTFLGKRTLPHHSSYGCPFFCNFCAVVNMVNGRWLAQSAEHTAHVVYSLVQTWNLDAVEFYDNNFFVHEARSAEFAERIMDLGISWWGESRVDTLLKYSDQTWALLRDSGLKMVFMGAESGSDDTLRRMNKGGTASTQKTLAIAAKTAQYGIIPEFSFVLGNPPDPEADVQQTLAFIRRVKQVNPRAEIILYTYTPVPLAGELYDQAKAEGFVFPATLEEWVNPAWLEFSQRRNTHVPWLKDPLRQQLHDFERVLNAYYPTATNPHLGSAACWVLRVASGWRYRTGMYRHPLELRALQKVLAYQRAETSGL
ncbi:MAG TPA: radical SAM protein, partial [Chloroflexota bacterium]